MVSPPGLSFFSSTALFNLLPCLFVLFCFVLFCFVLFCFVLFCFVLFCFVLFCFILLYFVLFCFILFYFALFCFVFHFPFLFPFYSRVSQAMFLLMSMPFLSTSAQKPPMVLDVRQ